MIAKANLERDIGSKRLVSIPDIVLLKAIFNLSPYAIVNFGKVGKVFGNLELLYLVIYFDKFGS